LHTSQEKLSNEELYYVINKLTQSLSTQQDNFDHTFKTLE